jgi:hypothetical protein
MNGGIIPKLEGMSRRMTDFFFVVSRGTLITLARDRRLVEQGLNALAAHLVER